MTDSISRIPAITVRLRTCRNNHRPKSEACGGDLLTDRTQNQRLTAKKAQNSGSRDNAASRQGTWKFVKLKKGKWELYDLEKDRSEMNNLAQTHPEKARELEVLWEKHTHRTLIYPKPHAGKKK